MERALGEPVQLLATSHGMRMHAAAPAPRDPVWPRLLDALRSADDWGSTDSGDTPQIWAEVNEG